MKYLQPRVAGRTRRNQVRCQRIRDTLSVLAVKETVEKMQLKWFGHMCRMNEARPRGRPRPWTEHISRFGERKDGGLDA